MNDPQQRAFEEWMKSPEAHKVLVDCGEREAWDIWQAALAHVSPSPDVFSEPLLNVHAICDERDQLREVNRGLVNAATCAVALWKKFGIGGLGVEAYQAVFDVMEQAIAAQAQRKED